MDCANLCIRIATVDYDGEIALKYFQNERNIVKSRPEVFVNAVAPRIKRACDQFERFTKMIHDVSKGLFISTEARSLARPTQTHQK